MRGARAARAAPARADGGPREPFGDRFAKPFTRKSGGDKARRADCVELKLRPTGNSRALGLLAALAEVLGCSIALKEPGDDDLPGVADDFVLLHPTRGAAIFPVGDLRAVIEDDLRLDGCDPAALAAETESALRDMRAELGATSDGVWRMVAPSWMARQLRRGRLQ